MVPLGIAGFCVQSAGSTRPDFVARLLGAHRIRLRAILNFAERAVQHCEGDRGSRRDFRRNARALSAENTLEERAKGPSNQIEHRRRNEWTAQRRSKR